MARMSGWMLALAWGVATHAWIIPSVPRLGVGVRVACVRCAVTDEKPPEQMRLSELKAELDARKVSWRGTCFDKKELVAKLQEARSHPAPASAASSGAPADDKGDEAKVFAEVSAMKAAEIKRELKKMKVDTSALFEKDELVRKLVEVRLTAVQQVEDDDVYEPEIQRMERASRGDTGGMPGGMGGMGGMPGGMGGMGGMPGGMGGMGGMGGIPGGMGGMGGLADLFSRMGVTGGMPGGMPGGMGGMPGGMGGMPGGMGGMPGGMGGMPGGMGGMPGGMGGMGDMLQKMMSNPRAMELMQKAQSNPKVMAAIQDVQKNGPQAMQKYANDPEIMQIITELQKIMR